ncbi:LysE family translocator [Kocuria sp.]|uniref:LysE family translocator n=1 Tax=Kocuria sp. TaxID=1871328 RepID=UPI0026DAB4B3|nr:LysE family transporter [Kocuria sp.]MDO4917966.1 LysE family transporter [Kocuria sp.]
MTVLDAVLAFALVAGLLTLVPGLDTALVLRSTLTRTRSYAWATALGVATGAGTNLLNPKVGVFYIATIPQFLPGGVSPLLMGALLAGVHGLLTMVWFGVIILGGGYARRWLSDPRALRVVDRVTGVVLIGFGVKLVVDAIPSGAVALGRTLPRLA